MSADTTAVPQTVEQLWQIIERQRLLSPADLPAVHKRWFRPNRKEVADLDSFYRWLKLNRFLNDFLVLVLKRGHGDKLTLNQYRVRDHLQTGPMAGSFLATDPLERQVIVEVLLPSLAQDPAVVQTFQTLAEQAMKVQHPQVLAVLDVGQAKGLHFLVKEYCEGETLAAVLKRRGRLGHEQAAKIFLLALTGLQELHEQGVPALDLSPAGLLLTAAASGKRKQRTLKLLNVGVPERYFLRKLGETGDAAVIPDQLSLAELELPAPMPLEATHPRHEADLFQLGCSFYECLTGSKPFPADELPSPSQPAVPIRQLGPEVPELLAETVEAMISPDPSARPRKAADVAKTLRIHLAHEEETHVPAPEEAVAAPLGRGDDDEDVPARSPAQPAGRRHDDGPIDWHRVLDEIKPRERDLVFLAAGAAVVVLLIVFVHIFTGIRLSNIVFLLAGLAMAWLLERFIRWRMGETVEET